MANNQSSKILQTKPRPQFKNPNIPILEPEIMGTNQDHKRRCFEKLVVRRDRITQQNVENDVFEIEVIDDTALIDVSWFKKFYKKKSDVGFENKKDHDGKIKRNKGVKKVSAKCSMKCVTEKKGDVVKEKKVYVRKGYGKMSGKVKAVYRRKDGKCEKLVEMSGVEEKNVDGKIVGEGVQESDVGLIGENGDGKEESNVEVVGSEIVDEKDDGLTLSPEMDGSVEKNGEEDQEVCENVTVGSKKVVYSRVELEALRFVDEEGQKSKWTEVYGAFAPLVAREYTGLVVDFNNWQTQRCSRVGNCGLTRHGNDNAILGVPPVLPLCSMSNYRKIVPYDRVGFRVNFN